MVKSRAKQQEKGVHARHGNEKDVTEAVKAVVMGKMSKSQQQSFITFQKQHFFVICKSLNVEMESRFHYEGQLY